MAALACTSSTRIPRLYAAASLKPDAAGDKITVDMRYSAALCRGLIEAPPLGAREGVREQRIPRLYAAASLKRCFRPG